MIIADAPPPAIFCPAPLPSRNIMTWGDDAAMDTLRITFEAKGWTWATMVLAEQTKALVLGPPTAVGDQQLCALVSEINGGKFGKLNAGFATFGFPTASPNERGR